MSEWRERLSATRNVMTSWLVRMLEAGVISVSFESRMDVRIICTWSRKLPGSRASLQKLNFKVLSFHFEIIHYKPH